MMTNEEYSAFRKKINPIIKACSVSEDQIGSVGAHLATYHGMTTFTDQKTFYFDDRIAMSYQSELLAICRELPKTHTALKGSACCISSTDLVKATPSAFVLKTQFEAAEKFMVILHLAEISTFRPVRADNETTFLVADVLYRHKDKVL